MSYFIVDSGSSKADWVFVNNAGDIEKFQTKGFNPSYKNLEELTEEINTETQNKLGDVTADSLFYYGAGCLGDERVNKMVKALRNVFKNISSISVNHDLKGAARACLGNGTGLISIMGTGAVMGYYDGSEVKSRVPAPGYLLDDVGSGMHMGKTLLKMYIYDELEPELKQAFFNEYNRTAEEMIVDLCKSDAPNRFMASFSMFLNNHRSHEQIQLIIKDCMKMFFENHVCKYNNHQKESVNFVGSIAFIYRDFLEELAKDYKVRVGKILKTPMNGLIEYHALH